MSFRTWPFAPLAAALVLLFAAPAPSQPPSPLELVRGLRENGQVDLALEYLKELEGRPLSADDKAALNFERAKCLLDASEDEADEGTRLGMVAEAKEKLQAFLVGHPNHPRRVEALLTDAKLISLDAREQLNRARRIDIPPGGDTPEERAEREAAEDKQKALAKEARPMFLLAAKRFNEASDLLRARLADKALDPLTRRVLDREAFEAELAAGVNQFNTAETYMPVKRITTAEKEERNKLLEQAKKTFEKLGTGPSNNRTVWIARAWVAEVIYEQDDHNAATAAVAAVLKAAVLEAEDGKRMVRFFQLRRNWATAMGSSSMKVVSDADREIRGWLDQFGKGRKPPPEVFSVRYYLARLLQREAALLTPASKDPKKPTPITDASKAKLADAEKIFRELSQTDNDYTARATRQRMVVVRLLLDTAEQPPAAYTTFEKAQMASLIQLSYLAAAEAMPEKTDDEKTKKVAAIRDRQMKVIAMLERSRELASPQDAPADVNDVLLRLIYFYQLTDQPYAAAVLGEHVAHTMRTTGGKASLAGLFAINGYLAAARRATGETPEAVAAARRADRARAMAVARFLDQKYPNDTATDSARHQLGFLLTNEGRIQEAFEILLKIRPGYAQVAEVRLLEGYLASQLVLAKDSPLDAAKKAEVFRRAVADLARTPRPSAVASEADVRGYLSARCRLASLLFIQGRADPEAEKSSPGYNQALAITEEVLAIVPSFDCLMKTEGGTKSLNLDGLEMTMLAQETNTRAVYLRARALVDAGSLEDAAKLVQPTLDAVGKGGPAYTAEMKSWVEGAGGDGDAPQKARIGKLAEATDRTRIDVILAAFRLQVKQAKAAEAEALINLLDKAGGSVADSLPVLEPVGRELAAQMNALLKDGKKAEADAIGVGLAVLLKKITTVPNLPQATNLFVGQMLLAVHEYDKAIETLKKIPEPEFKDWKTTPLDKLPNDKPEHSRIPSQIRDYSAAQLAIARALKEGKKYDDAEKHLVGIIGTPDKPSWGASRLYFRRELAMVYEEKAVALGMGKPAETEWGKALKEWTALFGIQRNRLSNLPKDATPDQIKQYRNSFADAFFDFYRCKVRVYQNVRKDKLQAVCDEAGKEFANVEKQVPAGDWQPEVQHRYADFLKEVPQIAKPYQDAGGKLFLTKLPLP